MEPDDKKPDYCPRQSGSMDAYKPQWKNKGVWGSAVNARHIGLEGGDKWTDVPYITIRGGAGIKLADGREVPLGVPYPRFTPGIYETIHLCGYEQAMALAWAFAAWVTAAGGEIEVRAEQYDLSYEIKAKLHEGKKAA